MRFDAAARDRELKRLVCNPTVASYVQCSEPTMLRLWTVGHDKKCVLHLFVLEDYSDEREYWLYERHEMPPESQFEIPDYPTLDECEE